MTQKSKLIEKGVVKQRPLTAVAAMEELSRVMAVPVKVKKETIWLRVCNELSYLINISKCHIFNYL